MLRDMQFSELAEQRDLLEGLDTEPLVDYLHSHGVLSKTAVDTVLRAGCQRERNALLLAEIERCAETTATATGESPSAPQSHPNGHSAGFPLPSPTVEQDADAPLWSAPVQVNAFALFVNALRHTGYHRLASLLDQERRIHPAAAARRGSKGSFSESFTRIRRRGQLAVLIQLNAIKVSAAVYGLKRTTALAPVEISEGSPPAASAELPTEEENIANNTTASGACWISLEDLRNAGLPLLGSARKTHSVPAMDLSRVLGSSLLLDEVTRRQKRRRRGCCGCWEFLLCRRGKRRPSTPSTELRVNIEEVELNGNGVSKSKSDHGLVYTPGPTLSPPVAPSDTDSGVESAEDTARRQRTAPPPDPLLARKAALLTEKSERFGEYLGANHLEFITRWFEQDHGVLFLDWEAAEGFLAAVICTRGVQATRLREEAISGQLAQQLERRVVTDDLLRHLGVKRLKLGIEIDEEEVQEAVREFPG